jgi:peptide/nickel transport system substrate-binding protein
MSVRSLALALAVAAAAPGCSSGPPADPAIIRVAVVSSPNNLDPRIGTDEASQRIHQLLFDQLFRIDDALRVVPGLAESLTQPDPVTYLVALRRGVRFHDGRELTSADVAYTFNCLIDPAFVSAKKGAYRMLASVQPVGRYAVEFKLKEPFGSFPVNLVMSIVPAGSGASLASAPIGTGPFKLERNDTDDRVIVSANRDYYDGPPRNAGLELRVIPDDIMRGLELRQGAVDLVVNDLAPDIVGQFERERRLQIVSSPGTDFAYVGINLRDPVLRDVRVRRAIACAVDRAAIVKYLRRGLASPAVGVLPPMSWAFERHVTDFGYDPDKAKRLLDEAGYPDPDGDGPATRFNVTLKVSSTEFNRLQSAVIQQDLRRIGIGVDVRAYEFATLYADVLRGNFQLFTLQWVGVSDPDMLRRVCHSRQMPPTGFNRGFFSDPEVDRLIDDATVSIDENRRRELYGRVQKLVADQVPYVSLWYKTNVAVARQDIRGLALSPSADFRFLKDVWRGAPNE